MENAQSLWIDEALVGDVSEETMEATETCTEKGIGHICTQYVGAQLPDIETQGSRRCDVFLLPGDFGWVETCW